MSAGYASRLSEYPNKGVCGLPELYDSQRALKNKLQKFIELFQSSKYVVFLTGAGISTSAGIPDFRGPTGIWTKEQEKSTSSSSVTNSNNKRKRTTNNKTIENKVEELTDFSMAQPTLTHYAISKLINSPETGTKYCITQNVDGLHARSGLSRHYHSAIHGCAFTEKCCNCHTEYFRDKDVGGISFQPTGNICSECKTGKLHDTLLDWEDPLPEPEYTICHQHCERADLVVTLGTSLRIEPAGSLPLLAKHYVIVNLQPTPKDETASFQIRAPVDTVMDALMTSLFDENWLQNYQSSITIERVWKPNNLSKYDKYKKKKQKEYQSNHVKKRPKKSKNATETHDK